MPSPNRHVRTGTCLPAFQNFDPSKAMEQLGSFCNKYKIPPETIRGVIVDPILKSGEVVSFRGEAPVYAYACGKQPDAITRMAHMVIAAAGLSQKPEAEDARNELWKILRDFSVGYGIPVEEHIGLITVRALQEKFNFQSVQALTTMRFMKDFSGALVGHTSSFGKIRAAFLDIYAGEMGPDTFSAVFSMFIQGQIPAYQEDGSVLCINPTHSRSLTSPPLKSDTPYIVSTTVLSGAYSIGCILPQEESLGIRLDLLLWRKVDTLIIADVTGSFQ